MNKRLLLLVAAGVSLQSVQASFFQKIQEKGKELSKKFMPDIKKQVEKQTGVKVTGKIYPTDTKISFQLRNKAGALWVAVASNGEYPGEQNQTFKVAAGSPANPTTLEIPVDIAKKTDVQIWTSEPGDRAAEKHYTFPENKTLYVTWDGNLRPQTGKFLGALGSTTVGGYSLENNVKEKEITATAPTAVRAALQGAAA